MLRRFYRFVLLTRSLFLHSLWQWESGFHWVLEWLHSILRSGFFDVFWSKFFHHWRGSSLIHVLFVSSSHIKNSGHHKGGSFTAEVEVEISGRGSSQKHMCYHQSVWYVFFTGPFTLPVWFFFQIPIFFLIKMGCMWYTEGVHTASDSNYFLILETITYICIVKKLRNRKLFAYYENPKENKNQKEKNWTGSVSKPLVVGGFT